MLTPTPMPTPAPTPTPTPTPAPTPTPSATPTPAPTPTAAPSLNAQLQASCQTTVLTIVYGASASGGAQVTRVQVMADGSQAADSGAIYTQSYGPVTTTLFVALGGHTIVVEAKGSDGLSDTANGTVTCRQPPAPAATPRRPARY